MIYRIVAKKVIIWEIQLSSTREAQSIRKSYSCYDVSPDDYAGSKSYSTFFLAPKSVRLMLVSFSVINGVASGIASHFRMG